VVSGPNQTVQTQRRSTAQGSAGAFKSSTGAQGAAVHGAGGTNAGVVKGAGGDVYAGADGNVYKKTSTGWSKYDDGSWNAVQKPSGAQKAAPAKTATPAQHGTASRAAPGAPYPGQLDQDRQARTAGSQRQQQFNANATRGAAQGTRDSAGRGGSARR
jgi:hypothetical protein